MSNSGWTVAETARPSSSLSAYSSLGRTAKEEKQQQGQHLRHPQTNVVEMKQGPPPPPTTSILSSSTTMSDDSSSVHLREPRVRWSNDTLNNSADTTTSREDNNIEQDLDKLLEGLEELTETLPNFDDDQDSTDLSNYVKPKNKFQHQEVPDLLTSSNNLHRPNQKEHLRQSERLYRELKKNLDDSPPVPQGSQPSTSPFPSVRKTRQYLLKDSYQNPVVAPSSPRPPPPPDTPTTDRSCSEASISRRSGGVASAASSSINQPYHTLQDSKPFSYIKQTANMSRSSSRNNYSGLESPSLLRKIIGGNTDSDDVPLRTDSPAHSTTTSSSQASMIQRPQQVLRPMQNHYQRDNHQSQPRSNEFDRNSKGDNVRERHNVSDEEASLSWLERQQRKLEERREADKRKRMASGKSSSNLNGNNGGGVQSPVHSHNNNNNNYAVVNKEQQKVIVESGYSEVRRPQSSTPRDEIPPVYNNRPTAESMPHPDDYLYSQVHNALPPSSVEPVSASFQHNDYHLQHQESQQQQFYSTIKSSSRSELQQQTKNYDTNPSASWQSHSDFYGEDVTDLSKSSNNLYSRPKSSSSSRGNHRSLNQSLNIDESQFHHHHDPNSYSTSTPRTSTHSLGLSRQKSEPSYDRRPYSQQSHHQQQQHYYTQIRNRYDSEPSSAFEQQQQPLDYQRYASSVGSLSDSRPITPAFPSRGSRINSSRAPSPGAASLYTTTGLAGDPNNFYSLSRRGSVSSEPAEVNPTNVKLVKDHYRFWYKPNISREEAISMLKYRPPGTFVVRDSNSYAGAFGLALKVATPPANLKSITGDPASELVRHFLIEPTSKGVRLKGYANEPVFASLSALVYQHTVTQLALPIKLVLPESDLVSEDSLDGKSSRRNSTSSQMAQLLSVGAACNVTYLFVMETDTLTGPAAVKRSVHAALTRPPSGLDPLMVHFKVSDKGITLTDNKRKRFFRQHFPTASITYCGVDPDDRRWVNDVRVFAFVAKKPTSKLHNQCHVFAEFDPEQPARAIVNFVNKVMMNSGGTATGGRRSKAEIV